MEAHKVKIIDSLLLKTCNRTYKDYENTFCLRKLFKNLNPVAIEYHYIHSDKNIQRTIEKLLTLIQTRLENRKRKLEHSNELEIKKAKMSQLISPVCKKDFDDLALLFGDTRDLLKFLQTEFVQTVRNLLICERRSIFENIHIIKISKTEDVKPSCEQDGNSVTNRKQNTITNVDLNYNDNNLNENITNDCSSISTDTTKLVIDESLLELKEENVDDDHSNLSGNTDGNVIYSRLSVKIKSVTDYVFFKKYINGSYSDNEVDHSTDSSVDTIIDLNRSLHGESADLSLEFDFCFIPSYEEFREGIDIFFNDPSFTSISIQNNNNSL